APVVKVMACTLWHADHVDKLSALLYSSSMPNDRAPSQVTDEEMDEAGGASAAAPTQDQFSAYRLMFAHFNRELFEGTLPEPLLNRSRGPRKMVAFFAPDRWAAASGGETAHEISLNPAHLRRGTARETAQSLAHEMVHLWQQMFGRPSRQGYHNREWSTK